MATSDDKFEDSADNFTLIPRESNQRHVREYAIKSPVSFTLCSLNA